MGGREYRRGLWLTAAAASSSSSSSPLSISLVSCCAKSLVLEALESGRSSLDGRPVGGLLRSDLTEVRRESDPLSSLIILPMSISDFCAREEMLVTSVMSSGGGECVQRVVLSGCRFVCKH